MLFRSLDLLPAAIDKLTEQSQVSEDGTMVTVPKKDSPPAPRPDHTAVTGTSDTESNSGRDTEVRRFECPPVAFSSWVCVSVNRRLYVRPSQDVFYTEAEMERRRVSSASSVSYWAATPDWVSRHLDRRRPFESALQPSRRPGSPAASPFCPLGSLLEVQAPAANHHATAASPRPPGGKDLH